MANARRRTSSSFMAILLLAVNRPGEDRIGDSDVRELRDLPASFGKPRTTTGCDGRRKAPHAALVEGRNVAGLGSVGAVAREVEGMDALEHRRPFEDLRMPQRAHRVVV